MPFVYLSALIFFSFARAFAADVDNSEFCGSCNIFRKQVDISRSPSDVPAAARPPVFKGGRVALPEASERNFRTAAEPSQAYKVDVVPANNSGTVSVKRLAHKPPKAARKAFEQAVKLSAKGQSLEAIAMLQKAVQIDPEYVEAWNNLGARYVVLGQYQQALEPLNTAISIDPHSAQPYCNMSLAYLGLGEPKAAERAARQAVDNDPSESRGRYLLGVALVAQQKDVQEAKLNLRRVEDQFPQAKYAIAIAETIAGNTAAAKASLTEYLAVEGAPKREEAQQLLASLEAAEKKAAQK